MAEVEVALLGVGLAQEHAELGGIAVACEQLREDPLGLRGALALDQGQAVGELKRGIDLALRVVLEQLDGLGVGLGVEPGQSQHAAEAGVVRIRGERAQQRLRSPCRTGGR